MNVYHKVLVKLYEETGGKDSHQVDLKELVKGLGFLGNYPDIFKQLSRQGWIAETRRADVVSITHWGVKEAKKAGGGLAEESESMKILKRETNGLKANAKDFGILLDEFSGQNTKESFGILEQKFKQMSQGMDKIKENLE
ncbi:MAG: hypothetical protein R2747_06445 [Pyrinomonadaceae bacterium]